MDIRDQPTLAFYAQPAAMTSAGGNAPLLESLPHDIPGLAGVAQGLLIHEHMAQGYGVTLSEADRASVHVRPVERLLGEILARDSRPLDVARPPAARLPGNCRHFTVLMTAMLRAQGTPARARCGFGGYFGTGMFEDHWVCEYWHSGRQRWILADAQIDDTQRGWFRARCQDLASPSAPAWPPLFDRLAALTQTPDAAFAELRELCDDERLRVPPAVRNALRDRDESVAADGAVIRT